jgi:1-acyl-sn-glycerol-3-phosphate acyltransferase
MTAPRASARLAAGLLVVLTRLVTGVRAHGPGVAELAAAGVRQRVYFANHTSHLDALVIWSTLPPAARVRTRPVAAQDYWDRPGLRRWVAVDVLNALCIPRGAQAARDALHRLDAALGAGDSLILFPEGTRGDGDALATLKPGLHRIAERHPGVDLVPVHLENLSRILPKGEVLPVPLIGRALFGVAIRLEPGEGREAFLGRARDCLLALRAQCAGDARQAGAAPCP